MDGRELTLLELAEAVGDDRLRESWAPCSSRPRRRAAAGRLCFAPSLGPNVRFTRPDWPKEDAAGALERVTRRYLAAGAPARREDLARWWGVSPAEGGRMLAALGDELTEAVVEGEPMWMLRADAERAAGAEPTHSCGCCRASLSSSLPRPCTPSG